MTTLRIGSEVGIGPDGTIAGTITAVMLRGNPETTTVLYEVVWWDGLERKECWLADHEVRPAERAGRFQGIGFGA